MEEIKARMSAIEDPRHPSYVKYTLADILIIIMCAVLCGLDILGDLVTYAKNKATWHPYLLPRSDEMNARYKNPDNDPRGPWKPADFSVRTYNPDCDYPVTLPSGRVVTPPESRAWVANKARFDELIADNRIGFGTSGNNVPAVKKFLSEI